MDRTTGTTPVRLHRDTDWRFGCPFSFSDPYLARFDSSMRSLPPFVHDFPYSDNDFRIARLRSTDYAVSVWSSGFSPPRCYQRITGPESKVLPVNLPPSVPSRFGVSSALTVLCRFQQHQQQYRRASPGKTHHLPISRPASCQFSSPDIRSRVVRTARPHPQHHTAGSLFATYTGSASCFLQTFHFWICPCLVGVVLPSGNGGLYRS